MSNKILPKSQAREKMAFLFRALLIILCGVVIGYPIGWYLSHTGF